MKIVFLDEETIGAAINLDPLKQLGNYIGYESTPPELVIERAGDCDILIINKIKVTPEVIDGCKNLKLICEAATGVNNIDVEYAQSKGIPVKNVAGYSTESVVQITFTHILSQLNNIEYFNNYVKDGSYSKSGCFTEVKHNFYDLDGKTMGIIGMGTIGHRVAEVAKAFKMNVCYYSTSGTNHCTDFPAVDIDELLATSDIISIHAPMNARTNNLITLEQMKKMKKSAIIVNMGRGGIVNENDLAKAIDEDIIAGAAFDVFSQEPIPADHPFMKIKNKHKLSFTPHIGWASVEARVRLLEGIIKNIQEFL